MVRRLVVKSFHISKGFTLRYAKPDFQNLEMPMKKTPYYILIFLSIAVAIFLEYTNNYALFKLFKPLTTILIIGIPILFGNKNNKVYNRTIIAALIFCLGGDIFLFNPDNFVFGLASFLVGHLIFAYAFISIKGFGKNLLSLSILGLVAGAYLIYLKPNLDDLFIPVLFYITAIVFMNWQAICLYLKEKNNVYLLLAVGATLFTFSDVVIAFNKFITPFELSGVIILSCYWIAILLMANSAATVRDHSSLDEH